MSEVSDNIYFVMATVSITTNRYASMFSIVRDNRFDVQIDYFPCGTVCVGFLLFRNNRRRLFVLCVK
jgi:hypothetical protein